LKTSALTHLTNIRTRNRGAHTDIARITGKEVAVDLLIIPASDTVTPIRAVILITVIIVTPTEGTFARRSHTDAMLWKLDL
jgi:hypothetical protein